MQRLFPRPRAKDRLPEIAKQREFAWEMYTSGKIRAQDVQERHDALTAQRDELQGRLTAVTDQIAASKAVSDRDNDADAILKQAAATFAHANESQQRTIARPVAADFGGLHGDKSGTLKPGLAAPAQQA